MDTIQKLRNFMEEKKVDSFFIAKPANVRYISSYTGDDSYLLVTQKKQFLSQIRDIRSRRLMSVRTMKW